MKNHIGGTTKKSYEELSSIRSKNKSIYLPNGVNSSNISKLENKNHIINIGYIGGHVENYEKKKGEAINKLTEISKNRKILITVIMGW